MIEIVIIRILSLLYYAIILKHRLSKSIVLIILIY